MQNVGAGAGVLGAEHGGFRSREPTILPVQAQARQGTSLSNAAAPQRPGDGTHGCSGSAVEWADVTALIFCLGNTYPEDINLNL